MRRLLRARRIKGRTSTPSTVRESCSSRPVMATVSQHQLIIKVGIVGVTGSYRWEWDCFTDLVRLPAKVAELPRQNPSCLYRCQGGRFFLNGLAWLVCFRAAGLSYHRRWRRSCNSTYTSNDRNNRLQNRSIRRNKYLLAFPCHTTPMPSLRNVLLVYIATLILWSTALPARC